MSGSLLRRELVTAVLLGAVACGLAAWRVARESEVELHAARVAEQAQDLDGAIIHYRRAASWYLPWLWSSERAMRSLERLASTARGVGDGPRELSAVRAALAALESRRVMMSPQAEATPLRQRVVELTVDTASAAIGDGRTHGQRVAALERAYRDGERPNPLGVALALVGLLCWIVSAFLMPVHGLNAELELTAAGARLGTLTVIGLGLCALGLALA